MKNQGIISIAILTLLFSACSKDFQSSKWGDSMIQCKWENKSSEVMHAIFGENGQVSHAVEYQGIQSGK